MKIESPQKTLNNLCLNSAWKRGKRFKLKKNLFIHAKWIFYNQMPFLLNFFFKFGQPVYYSSMVCQIEANRCNTLPNVSENNIKHTHPVPQLSNFMHSDLCVVSFSYNKKIVLIRYKLTSGSTCPDTPPKKYTTQAWNEQQRWLIFTCGFSSREQQPMLLDLHLIF